MTLVSADRSQKGATARPHKALFDFVHGGAFSR